MSTSIIIDRCDSVARLTLNRPEQGNAINLELAETLRDTVINIDRDKDIRCVVIQGADRFFSVGGDIKEFSSAKQPDAYLAKLAGTLHHALSHIARMQKPVVAVVNGPAAGAGFSLALAADIAVAAHSAHFSAAYTSIGLTPDGGITFFLPRMVGLAVAKDLIMSNRRCSAEEAKALGLVARCVADEELPLEVDKLVAQLVNGPRCALGVTRTLLNSSFSETFETQIALEARAIAQAGAGDEFAEGFAAFTEKRKPQFRNI